MSKTAVPYGLEVLPRLYEEWMRSGMIANIGSRLVDAGMGTLTLEAVMSPDRHSFESGHGLVVHGGATATLADEALATVAYTLAAEGETTVTSSLHVDYYRTAAIGKLIAHATVRHRTKRLAYCHVTVEQEDGVVVAEGRATIAYVKA